MLEWNLNNIFISKEEFYKSVQEIKEKLNNLGIYKDRILDANNLCSVLNLKYSLKEQANNVLIYGSLNYYKDVSNEKNIKMKELGEKLINEVEIAFNFVDKVIIKLGKQVEDYFYEKEELRVYKLYIDNVLRLNIHVPDNKTALKIKNINKEINKLFIDYNNLK